MRAVKITIEEWAGDNGIDLSDKQVDELKDAIWVCQDPHDLGGYETVITPEEREVDTLKKKISALEGFIRDKGFDINYGDNYVTEHTTKRISASHTASSSRTHKYY